MASGVEHGRVRAHGSLAGEAKEQAAKRQGVTKSQFIIAAVERALGRRNPHELMVALKAEEQASEHQALGQSYACQEQAYQPAAARRAIVRKLSAKHGGVAG